MRGANGKFQQTVMRWYSNLNFKDRLLLSTAVKTLEGEHLAVFESRTGVVSCS